MTYKIQAWVSWEGGWQRQIVRRLGILKHGIFHSMPMRERERESLAAWSEPRTLSVAQLPCQSPSLQQPCQPSERHEGVNGGSRDTCHFRNGILLYSAYYGSWEGSFCTKRMAACLTKLCTLSGFSKIMTLCSVK